MRQVLRGLLGAAVLMVVLPWILLYLLFYLFVCILINITAWVLWRPFGKDTLFVYSKSPNWEEYLRANIIPHIEHRSWILNWSERRIWRQMSLQSLAFTFLGGSSEFNPMAVVFRPFRTPKIFRFYQPFRDYKHGHPDALRKMEDDFFATLGMERRGEEA